MAVHYFLVCPLLLLLTLVAVEALQYGRRGTETTLVPQIRGTPDAILWKQAFRNVVQFDGSEESVQETFRDRVVLDWHSASLTIKDLRVADSGSYELEATINNKKFYSQHEVLVIEKVATPTISCLINGTVSGVGESDPPRTRAVLRCSAEGSPSLITYAWTPLDGVATRGAGLTVALAGDQDDTVYTCLASNPVSQEMGTFVAKDCYPASFPTGGTIAIVVLCLLTVISAGCVVGYWRWSKAHPKSDGIGDEESQPLKGSNGSGNTKAYVDRATLPSNNRLPPPNMGEENTTHSRGGGDPTLASIHSSESRLPDRQQPSDPESADEHSGERLVAAGEPPVLQEEGEEEGQEVSSPQKASLPDSHSDSEAGAGERGTDGREEDTEETSNTADEKQDDAEGGTGKAAPPTEPDQEAIRRRGEEEENHVPGTSRDDPQGTKDDEGNDKGVASSPASKPESQQDSEAVVGEGEGDADRITKEEETILQQDNAGDGAGQVTLTVEPAVETPERKREDKTSQDGSEGQEEGGEEEESMDRGGASPPASRPEPRQDSEAMAGEGDTDSSTEKETTHRESDAGDGVGQVAPAAEPAVKTPEGEREDVPQTSPRDAERPKEGEVKEEDGKDEGGASLPASTPETDVYFEADAGGAITDTSMVDKKLDVESPEGKEKEDDVPQTVHGDPHVQEAEGVKEGGKTSLTEMESGPETGPDPDRQPGGSAAGRGGTQGSGGQHEGRKEETGDGPLSANHVEEEEVEVWRDAESGVSSA